MTLISCVALLMISPRFFANFRMHQLSGLEDSIELTLSLLGTSKSQSGNATNPGQFKVTNTEIEIVQKEL